MKEDLESPAFALSKLAKHDYNSKEAANSIRNPKYSIDFNTKYHQDLIQTYQKKLIPKKRKERIFPNILGKLSDPVKLYYEIIN